MPRPKRKKRVCCKKEGLLIQSRSNDEDVLTLTLEAYEAFRLIDYEHLTQLEASKQMDVARTTIQSLYQEARKIIAKSLVEDKMVYIKGGNHLMHDQNCCGHNKTKVEKLALVTNQEKTVSPYHGATQFHLITLNNNTIERQDLILPQGEEKKLCRRFMLSLGVNAIITTEMSTHHHEKYKACGINVFYAQEQFDTVLDAYLNQQLEPIDNHLTDDDYTCNHNHQHEHTHSGCHHNH